MKVPGFTAEVSLYRAGRLDATGSSRAQSRPSNSVQPAMSIYVDGLYYCEGYVDDDGVQCFRRNIRDPVHDPPCRPVCSPCTFTLGRGWSRMCIGFDCQVTELGCVPRGVYTPF